MKIRAHEKHYSDIGEELHDDFQRLDEEEFECMHDDKNITEKKENGERMLQSEYLSEHVKPGIY